ncbi:MAG: hypothetical protein ACRDRJ_19835 [Streptosporangiaceae bacterium]
MPADGAGGPAAGSPALDASPAASQAAWLRTRGDLNASRHRLTGLARRDFPAGWFVPGTGLLARPAWIPDRPVPLDRVRLRWSPGLASRAGAPAAFDGAAPELRAVRPLRDERVSYPRYSDAVADLARPGLFENRACYRLLEVGSGPAGPQLTFGRGRYFDLIDTCEAAAHEFAAAHPATGGRADGERAADMPFRRALGDPTDLGRRPVMSAVSTLTIRHDRAAGAAEFLLHWRDPAKVASGGGLYQVMPVGMFQPSHDAAWNEANDFDLWRSIVRELSEELLGTTEDYGSGDQPIDYAAWEFSRVLDRARAGGDLRVYWLGLGLDPLTYVADMLTVAVFEAKVFDEIFGRLVTANAEGHRVEFTGGTGRAAGLPLRADQVDRLTRHEPMQVAGAALLRLAWAHRGTLLAEP